MKRASAFLLTICFFSSAIWAQNSDYDKIATGLKTEIWGSKDPDFEGNTVPDQYKNESAIILAKRYNIDAKIKKHFSLSVYGNKEIIFKYLIRQKVLLQDKSALEDFSEISYNKINKSSFGLLFAKHDDLSTYIGARVYKKDGTMKEVLLSEAVLVKDEKNKKDEKLAISDLEVGDILDYYIVSLEKREMSNLDPMQFLLAGEYPILKLSLQGNIDKRYAVEYKCLNGAPDLKISKDEDGDMQFTIKTTDLSKFPVYKWISPYRQAKIVRLNISLCGGLYSRCEAGEVTKGITEDEIYNAQKNKLRNIALGYIQGTFAKEEKNYVKENIKLLKKRLGKEPSKDSLIYTIFNSLRYYGYYSPEANDKIYPGKSKNEASMPSNLFNALVCFILKDYGIENELIFYSSRYMPKIGDLMSYDQPLYMVHVNGAKSYYLTDDGIFSECGLVPGYAEGEKGVTLEFHDIKALYYNKSKYMDQGTSKIPISKADKNMQTEDLKVSLALTATPTASVDRKINATGLLKEDLQKSLMLYEDYYQVAWKQQGEEKTFIQVFADRGKTRSLSEEWQNSFTKSRETYKDGFIENLKDAYNSEPKELISYKVDKTGLGINEPFMFSTKFVMQDWLKKAGNNFIFEIGKAIDLQFQINEEDRKRSIDIYEPFARTYEFDLAVEIPAGFSVEGVDALNKKVGNECGSFTSTASIQGNQLIVSVKKEYTNNFEPAANWPKLMLFIDAASDFNSAKVLLKKK